MFGTSLGLALREEAVWCRRSISRICGWCLDLGLEPEAHGRLVRCRAEARAKVTPRGQGMMGTQCRSVLSSSSSSAWKKLVMAC